MSNRKWKSAFLISLKFTSLISSEVAKSSEIEIPRASAVFSTVAKDGAVLPFSMRESWTLSNLEIFNTSFAKVL